MPFNQICPVVLVRRVDSSHAELTVDAPDIAGACRPGQFVMVRPHPPGDLLLARPMSIHAVDREHGRAHLRFWIKVIGRGTAALAQSRSGQRLRLIGPLGHPFQCSGGDRPWLVAGGIGVAPLHFWATDLCARGLRPRFLYAARSRSELVALEDLRRLPLELVLATDDGSAGERGLASDILRRRLESGERGSVFTCGPEVMMRAVARVCREHALACAASLENVMGCGFGVCLGCVVWRRKAGESQARPARVCVEGTLFPTQELGW
ncbi:MAG: dihydroorotate dehydrogenase electron transfer subunit [Acidobacteriota bacterium]